MASQFSKNTGLFELGSFRGTPIFLSTTFFGTAGLLAYPFWHTFTWRGMQLAAIFIVAVFASVLVHELAHAMVARRYGVDADRIDINMDGGLVTLSGSPSRAQDFAITIAGPLSNLALGLAAIVLLLIYRSLPSEPAMILIGNQLVPDPYTHTTMLERVLRAIAYLNIGLGVINLLPGLPLDGGKLVYLLAERRWDAQRALLLVSSLGMFFACVSAFALIGTAIAGFRVWAPPRFAANLRAYEAARQGSGSWDAFVQ